MDLTVTFRRNLGDLAKLRLRGTNFSENYYLNIEYLLT